MGIRLRLTASLVALSFPGIVLVAFMTPQVVQNLGVEIPSVPVLIAAAMLQSLIITTLLATLGTFMAPRAGLAAPALEGWLAGSDPRPILKGQLRTGLPLGVAAGLVLVALEALIFRPHLPQALYMLNVPVTLKDAITALTYGGILEEVWLRWGFMSLLAWLFSKLAGRNRAALAIMGANLVAAVLFGVLHLPAVQGIIGEAPSSMVVVRTIALNSLPGILFGWLYWRRGLEAAMFAHMGAHLGMIAVRLILV